MCEINLKQNQTTYCLNRLHRLCTHLMAHYKSNQPSHPRRAVSTRAKRNIRKKKDRKRGKNKKKLDKISKSDPVLFNFVCVESERKQDVEVRGKRLFGFLSSSAVVFSFFFVFLSFFSFYFLGVSSVFFYFFSVFFSFFSYFLFSPIFYSSLYLSSSVSPPPPRMNQEEKF